MIDPERPNFRSPPGAGPRAAFSYTPVAGPPLFSIVTPYYDVPELFAETVECVRRLSVQRFEWVIVDDGSTDEGAVARLAQLEREDPRVRVVRQDNAGPSVARNRGFREASCPLVMILDADDLCEPTFAEKALMALDAHPDAAFCNSWSVGFGHYDYLWPRGFDQGARFLKENCVFPLAMVRRAVHLEVGGFDESIRVGHEDWDYWLNFSARGHWGITIPEYLGWYRRNADSRITETTDDPRRAREFEEFLRTKHRAQFERPESFPSLPLGGDQEFAPVPERLGWEQTLEDRPQALLMILPWVCMGGADKFNLDVVRLLTARGVPVTIATTLEGEDDWLPRFTEHTPDVFLLPRYLPRSHFPAALSHLIRSRRITHVMVSLSWLGYELLPWLRAQHPEVSFFDYVHIEEEYWRQGGYPLLSVGCQDLLDLTGTTSQHLEDWMVERGGDADRIEVCTINVDADEWNPEGHDPAEIRRAFELPGPERPLMLFAGRLVPQKHPTQLLQVLAQVAAKGRDFLALIAGDGPLAAELERRVERLGLQQQVRFLGKRPQEDIRRLLVVSDLLLLPSLMEGISLALYESMAMATPVVASRVGGQAELVDDSCGWLVEPGEGAPERFVAVLEEALSDRERLREMGAAARRRIVEHFPLEAMAERMLELMEIATRRRRPPPAIPSRQIAQMARSAVETARLQSSCDRLWRELQQQGARLDLRGQLRAFLELCRRTSPWRFLTAGASLRQMAGRLARRLHAAVEDGDESFTEARDLARKLRKLRGLRGAWRYRKLRRRARRCHARLPGGAA